MWYALHGYPDADLHARRRSAPWYRHKTTISYADMLAALRRVELDAKEEIRFGSDGRLIRREDRNGRSMTYESIQGANGTRLITKITDTRDRELDIFYVNDRIERIEDAAGRVWGYTYDARGDLKTYTDPGGGVTEYGYDAFHRLTLVIDPRDHATTISYEAPFRRAASVLRDGHTTRFSYDDREDAQCNEQGEDGEVIFASRITDARGNPTKFCVDEFAQVEQVFDANGNKRGTGYNSDGNVSSVASGAAGGSEFEYSGRDLSMATKASGAQNEFGYGTGVESHLPTSAADSGGNALSYGYDDKGNLESTSALGAGETGMPDQYLEMEYNQPEDEDPEGTLKSVTDGEDNT
ncbi:MAG: hypothetical protein MSC31_19375 [Solirubrobacteraceae bacterium MAG38_C4-C5]|nr:hypothetical protein [Candidatus Siliceabacter maunaloa]